jgi:hypothetical protein
VLKQGAFFEVDPTPYQRCGVDILMQPYIPVLPRPASRSEAGEEWGFTGCGVKKERVPVSIRKEVKAHEEVDLSFPRTGFGDQFRRNGGWVQSQSSGEASSQRRGETC